MQIVTKYQNRKEGNTIGRPIILAASSLDQSLTPIPAPLGLKAARTTHGSRRDFSLYTDCWDAFFLETFYLTFMAQHVLHFLPLFSGRGLPFPLSSCNSLPLSVSTSPALFMVILLAWFQWEGSAHRAGVLFRCCFFPQSIHGSPCPRTYLHALENTHTCYT